MKTLCLTAILCGYAAIGLHKQSNFNRASSWRQKVHPT